MKELRLKVLDGSFATGRGSRISPVILL